MYLQLCTDRPVVFLCVVFIVVDYNPVFAKKPNSLSVRLKRYISKHRIPQSEHGKSFMLYAPSSTQHTHAAFQVPVSPCELLQKRQMPATIPCCFLFSPHPLQPIYVCSMLFRAQRCPVSPTP